MTSTTPHIDKKKQLVPELRFRVFEGEWERAKFGELADITKLAGYEYTKHIVYSETGKIIGLRAINIKNNRLDLKDVQYIDKSEFSKLNRSKLRIGDMLFTYIGANIGDVAIIPENDRFYLAPNISRFRIDSEKAKTEYIFQYFTRGEFLHKEIRKFVASSSQPALSMESIRNFLINLPSLPEQQKIAAFLGAVDEKIQQLNRKKELLEQYKKGVMQKIFPAKAGQAPELRFKQEDGTNYPDWEEKRLGEMTERNICYGVVQPGIEDEKGVKFIRGGDVFNGKISDGLRLISKEITDQYKRTYLKGGELIMSLVGYPGETAIVPKELIGANLARQVGLIDLKPTMNTSFVHYYISSDIGKKNLLGKTIGSAQQVINIIDLKKLLVPIPKLTEQQKIADYLSNIDNKIESVNNQITLTQTFKKGLLQQMFV